MHLLSNKSRSTSHGESSWEDSGPTDSSQDVLNKANSVDLLDIFRYYSLHIDNGKMVCPFKNHKNGKENSGSLKFYEQTNTFHCFGCKVGTKASDFVANIEDISVYAAAYKILHIFSSDTEVVIPTKKDDYNDKLLILNDFSSEIRLFRSKFQDEKSFNFIEDLCKTFDKINHKHELSLEAVTYVINLIKSKIMNYERNI